MFPAFKSLLSDQSFEFCLAEVRFGCLKILVGGIYRSPITANKNMILDKLNAANGYFYGTLSLGM